LWCFNEEIVVRAIANSPLPTISAVGHEIDVTLSDLAADVRALTPSEAAEVVAPHREELLEQLEYQRSRLNALMQVHLQQRESRLFTLVSRPIIQEPERLFESVEQHLDQSGMDLERAITSILDQWDEKLRRSAELLEALSPLRTLARGYSITLDRDSGRLISQVGSAKIGSTIITELADGKLISQVQTISRKRPE
jgi:exodeoxyribonuclease VII large subunit